MQKSQLKRETKSLVAVKNNSHIGIWILILCKSRIVILHIMGFVIIWGEKSKALAALGRWSVGHARQARRWVSGVQGAERSASSTEPCRQWGSRGAVGDAMRTSRGVPHSTGRLPWDSCRSVWRRHGEGSNPLAGDALPGFGCTRGVPGWWVYQTGV